MTCAFVCGNPLLPLEGFDCNFAFCTSGFGRESGEELRCFNTFWLNGADMFLCSCRWEATLGKCFRNRMRSLHSESSLGIEHGWHPLSLSIIYCRRFFKTKTSNIIYIYSCVNWLMIILCFANLIYHSCIPILNCTDRDVME